LVEIADIQQLKTAEGYEGLVSKMTKDGVYGIEGVGADHADLIDDQKLEFLEQLTFGGGEFDLPEQGVRIGNIGSLVMPSIRARREKYAEG
jgi:hypothetical protein